MNGFPEVNGLTAPECRTALKMARVNRAGLIETALPVFDARVAAIEDRLRRLNATEKNIAAVNAALRKNNGK